MPNPKDHTLPMPDGKKGAEMAGFFRRREFDAFWESTRDEIRKRGADGAPVKLYAMFTVYLRDRILEVQPDLGGTDEAGFKRNDHQLNAILHRVMPGFNQFVEIWLERYDPVPSKLPLEGGDVAARARARVNIVHEKRRKGVSGNDGGERRDG